MHIGPGRYVPFDRTHVTYGIWQALASGFRDYHVFGRSAGRAADWKDGELRITLLRSRLNREAEFLLTQFAVVPSALRDRPDVIVCQSPALGGVAAILIGKLTGARTLIELHGAEFFADVTPRSRLWLLQRLTRFVVRRAHRIRVLTPRMSLELQRRYGADLADRTQVLPPRVDLTRFGAATPKEEDSRLIRVAIVGAVNPNKGQLRLIEALASTPFPLELHVVGQGPDLQRCVQSAAELRRSGSNLAVTCHGVLGHHAVADLLHTCDLLVMYSRTEAAPRAIMEAMAAGLPVVTTNAGYCADIVEHGVEGFVLGAQPDKEILDVISRFRSDPTLAKRMGAAARARAERDYDSVRLFEQYRQLIAETAAA